MNTKGLTLVELVVVVAILAVLAAALVPRMDHIDANAATQTTKTTMNAMRDAILGSDRAPGFVADLGHWPLQTHDLLLNDRTPPEKTFDINTRRGWNGPYLRSSSGLFAYGANGFSSLYFFYTANGATAGTDVVIVDGWNHPIVIEAASILSNVRTRSTNSLPASSDRLICLVSAGPDGSLNTDDDVLLFIERAGVQ